MNINMKSGLGSDALGANEDTDPHPPESADMISDDPST